MVLVVGETALVVVADAVEPVVAAWREQYDASAAAGVPAHVTVLYPFLPWDAITPAVLDQLAGLAAAEPAFAVTFAGFGRFPGGPLWLAPEPAAPFRRLTHAVWRAWPQAPPYRGAHAEVTPHLTLAENPDDALVEAVTADVGPALPLTAAATHVHLVVVRAEGAGCAHAFPLGA